MSSEYDNLDRKDAALAGADDLLAPSRDAGQRAAPNIGDPPGGGLQRQGEQTTPARPSEEPGESRTVENAPLFDSSRTKDLENRWKDVQVAFVDEPRVAVKRADSLVAETIKLLSDSFAATRQKLEREWDQGGDVSTEELRLTLQRYRSYFRRLLAT